jgi:hypothetical protein
MGINDKNLEMLEWVFAHYRIRSVRELGAQNLYQTYRTAPYGCYADRYYKLKGVESYECIDLNKENGAIPLDLSIPHTLPAVDMVTDFGTSEHVAGYTADDESALVKDSNTTWKDSEAHVAGCEAFYNCWTTKYNASRMLLVGANPATRHWKRHGHFYYTPEFYHVLCGLTGMKAIRVGEHYAMGNILDGKEVHCVLDVRGSHWISLEEFRAAFAYIYAE